MRGKIQRYLAAGFFVPMIFAFPASTNYKLHDFGFGSGGTGGSSSANYSIKGITGQDGGPAQAGTSFQNRPGFIFTGQANVPPAPTFTNPSNYYNKLHFVVSTGGNPSDAKFALAISDDDFVTTEYVQSDNTVGATLGPEDYQTYTGWGGAAGEDVIGLAASTTYKLKAKAIHGNFTETGYGPTATAATVGTQLSFCVYTAASCAGGGTSINFGDLLPGTVTNAPSEISTDFATNAASGGRVYVYADGTGLVSAHAGYTITSATADLAVVSEGFGGRGTSVTQSSGGPLSIVAPYDGAADNVGILNTNIRELFATPGPITGGKGTFLLKAKAQNITPAAPDYNALLTFIAAASF